MKLTECLNTFNNDEIASFWQLVETLKWTPGTNCKVRLLKDLSPSQSTKHKRILNYICETFAEELSTNHNFNKFFEAKAFCSNVIGEKGYQGYIEISKSPEKYIKLIESHNYNDLEDIFLLMIPDDDDYWY
ncbi:MAG: hypothetical protein ACO3UU_00790 [Minisyncoccia bacterium]